MNSKKYFILLFLIVLIALSTFACSGTNVDSSGDIIRNQTGILRWAGPPAVDGAGMLFIVDEIEYGAPGTPEDYSELFGDNYYEVEIQADFKLTGEETVRGWGATFPEIEFISIQKI